MRSRTRQIEQLKSELGLPEAGVAVCVGRLTAQKGQLDLARAWAESEASSQPHLYLVGDGPDADKIRDISSPSIHLVGHSDNPVDWLCAADVVVQPSRWEGLSYVTLEALASGSRLIALDAEGMSETVGTHGLVLDRGTT